MQKRRCQYNFNAANVTVDYEKWGVGMVPFTTPISYFYFLLFPVCKATLRCYTAVGWGWGLTVGTAAGAPLAVSLL
jgi:hypothetical protein